MDVEVQRRALALFEAALEQSDAGREAWLRDACGDDQALLAAVGRMLAADTGRDLLPTEPPEPMAWEERPAPDRIGPYRLTGLLGRGGMSAVYLGVRDDGLFDQTVAVKLMSAGLFSGTLEGFFSRERRILARLKHPNIAQLFDGGVDPGGGPYFIMERLTGAAIDDFARDRALAPRGVVTLLLQVCDAVRHAHAALVVHADIKPSNVLVDEAGHAKLLDFGIAQMAEDSSEEGAPSAFPLTPAYASPQRIAGEPPAPADDIWALGALLHDLLTGESGPKGGRGPPSRALAGARAAAVRGDLDAIAAKAMAPDPADRYGSVEALAEDLNRWLERRPVAARRPDWRMATGRFVQRHPLGVTAGFAAVAGLIVALAVTASLYVQAQRARDAADQRFAEVRGMAKYLMFDLYDGLDRTPQSLPLRRDVAREGQAYLDKLAADAGAPVEVRIEAVEGLARLARAQGAPGRPNLGEIAGARTNLQRGADLAAALTAAHPERTDVWLARARIEMERVVFLAQVDGSLDAAEAALARAKAALDAAGRLPGGREASATASVQWALRASELRGWQGRYAESLALGRTALAALQSTPDTSIEGRLRLARAWDTVAESAYYAKPESAAEAPYRAEMAVIEALARDHPQDPVVLRALVRARWALGVTLLSIGKATEALQVLDQGTVEARRLIAFDQADEDARRMERLNEMARGQALAAAHRWDEAIAILQAQMDERTAIMRRDPDRIEAIRDVAVVAAALGDVQADAGRKADACATYDQVRAKFEELRRRGRLTGLDQEHALGLLNTRMAQTCH